MGLQIVLLTSTPSSVYVHCSKNSLRISRVRLGKSVAGASCPSKLPLEATATKESYRSIPSWDKARGRPGLDATAAPN
ncbi:hypothetical protein Q31b_22450 [Novipirellula aureliae]|uniref:Uncharacterized protein n=1 Tax=Novipirellula aureliae TaxID=2527966 RepID=A0A5C6E5I0_9BACT|nr:hypothetical protein Q31b_22450 [Novipirellula aureliae]